MKTPKLLASLLLVWMTWSATPCFAQKSPDLVVNEKIVRDYYAAYEQKDWHIMELILADGFTFTSPSGDDNIELKESKVGWRPNVKTSDKFDLEKVIVAGDDAFVTYNGWTNDGRLFRNTERFKLKRSEERGVGKECRSRGSPYH